MTLTAPTRALDYRPVRVAIRAALLASGAVTAIVSARIFPDDDVAGGIYPFLTVSVPSAVPDYDYSGSRLNGLFDIIAVDRRPKEQSTTAVVDALAYAVQTALVDTIWAIPGYTMVGRQIEGVRPYTLTDVSGQVERYVAVTLRVIAEKQ